MSRLLIAGLLLSCSFVQAAVQQHPGLESVEQTQIQDDDVHRLITGRVKRMSGDVQPEAAEFVRGKRRTETFSVSPAASKDDLVEFYRQEIAATGQILFECEGRDCGPSNYWSNRVFEVPRLYGPTEYQHYLLAKIDDADVDYMLFYFSQRGTGKRFLHQVSISGVDEGITADDRLISSMLRLQRRFVFSLDSEMLAAMREVINQNSDFSLAVVAHTGPIENEGLEQSLARSEARAEEVKQMLADIGANTENLTTFGAGPMSPISRSNTERLELVKLN